MEPAPGSPGSPLGEGSDGAAVAAGEQSSSAPGSPLGEGSDGAAVAAGEQSSSAPGSPLGEGSDGAAVAAGEQSSSAPGSPLGEGSDGAAVAAGEQSSSAPGSPLGEGSDGAAVAAGEQSSSAPGSPLGEGSDGAAVAAGEQSSSAPGSPLGEGSDGAAVAAGEQSSSAPGSPPSPPGSGSDADARQSSRWHGWSERHVIIVGIWIASVGALLAAIAYGLIQLFQPNDSAVTEASQVAACVSEHHLTGISEGPSKVSSGIIVPFVRENFGTFFSQNPVYGRVGSNIPIPVALFASCSWPPSPGADITGYSQVLVSTVPGNVGGAFKGLANPYDYADVLDSSCRAVVIDYYFQHDLRSGSITVRVSAGELHIIDFGSATYPAPGPHGKKPNTVSSWAQTVGYYTTSGESVVLRSARAKLWKATCAS